MRRALFDIGQEVLRPREVALAQLIVLEDGFEAFLEKLLPPLRLLLKVETLTGRLDGKGAVAEVNSLLAESFLELLIESRPDFLLGRGGLVDPETHLVGKTLVVETGGEQSLLNDVQLHLLSPLIRGEVAGDLIGRYLLSKARVLRNRCLSRLQ